MGLAAPGGWGYCVGCRVGLCGCFVNVTVPPHGDRMGYLPVSRPMWVSLHIPKNELLYSSSFGRGGVLWFLQNVIRRSCFLLGDLASGVCTGVQVLLRYASNVAVA